MECRCSTTAEFGQRGSRRLGDQSTSSIHREEGKELSEASILIYFGLGMGPIHLAVFLGCTEDLRQRVDTGNGLKPSMANREDSRTQYIFQRSQSNP
uniref:Uncharacterized protein n=1 Tax=Leersia perrieri TaxID=77586 RepID=A0A0D9W3T5_9ORYZ